MLSDYLANALLAHIHAKAAFTMPTNLFVGLSTTTPTNTGTNVTPIGARQQTTAATWSTPSTRSIFNSAVIDFGTMSASGTITHVVVYDALTAGNFLFFVPLTTNKTVSSGDPVTIAVGAAATSI